MMTTMNESSEILNNEEAIQEILLGLESANEELTYLFDNGAIEWSEYLIALDQYSIQSASLIEVIRRQQDIDNVAKPS